MTLSVRRTETLKPKEKEQRFLDGKGLYLCLTPAGKKYWRVRYWLNGKASMISLGLYPEVSLKKAREANLEIKLLLDKGIHPNQYKKDQKTPMALGPYTFEKAAREWVQMQGVKPQTRKAYLQRLKANVFPLIGDKPVERVTEQDILNVLMPIHARKAWSILKRVASLCNAILAHAGFQRAKENSANISVTFPKSVPRPYRAPYHQDDLRQLMMSIEE